MGGLRVCHAHKLGRDIWSDHFARNGSALEPLGLILSLIHN